jgi:hypothetical protein
MPFLPDTLSDLLFGCPLLVGHVMGGDGPQP